MSGCRARDRTRTIEDSRRGDVPSFASEPAPQAGGRAYAEGSLVDSPWAESKATLSFDCSPLPRGASRRLPSGPRSIPRQQHQRHLHQGHAGTPLRLSERAVRLAKTDIETRTQSYHCFALVAPRAEAMLCWLVAVAL